MCLQIVDLLWAIYDGSSTQLFMCSINMSYSGCVSLTNGNLFNTKLDSPGKLLVHGFVYI